MASRMDSQTVIDKLCLACGLCCNGVLFKDVQIQPSDNRALLEAAGLALARPRPRQPATLTQPCAALCSNNCCRVYDNRPAHCRSFECALFQAVASDSVAAPAALKTIRAARRQAAKVSRLLARTGDADDSVPLRARFRRVQRQFDRGDFPSATNAVFAELTLAMHALNLLLSTHFYPDETNRNGGR